MKTTMTPRQLRDEIEMIDRRVDQLQPWEQRLTAARNRYLLQNERAVVALIDAGYRPGDGRPSDLDLEPFDRSWPGLRETHRSLAELRERRALLIQQLPSETETIDRTNEADARAADIRARAEDLATRTAEVQTALNDAARLALEVADDTRRLWEDNAALDKFATAADVTRPDTPHLDAATFSVAMPLSVLLRYFSGGQPNAVDSNLRREICDAA